MSAARNSFSSAETNQRRGNYEQAVQEYQIVINSVPVTNDSRRYLEMRMESIINMVEIYFDNLKDFTKACQFVYLYLDDMDTIREGEVLRASQLLRFLRKEQEYLNDHLEHCKKYQEMEDTRERFRRKIQEEEFFMDKD